MNPVLDSGIPVKDDSFLLFKWAAAYLFFLSIGYYFQYEAIIDELSLIETRKLGLLCCFGCDNPYFYHAGSWLGLATYLGLALSTSLFYRNRWKKPDRFWKILLLINPLILFLTDWALRNWIRTGFLIG